ncbi:hypothetical protein HanIR_Chr01g0016581 [Helianthus annuus]|nr:hypothetical protein HanIR_Chr01g0016581 [Helianthus annuus]
MAPQQFGIPLSFSNLDFVSAISNGHEMCSRACGSNAWTNSHVTVSTVRSFVSNIIAMLILVLTELSLVNDMAIWSFRDICLPSVNVKLMNPFIIRSCTSERI